MCVALGLVGLLAILLAVASGSVPGVKSEPSTAAQKALAAVQKAPVVRYVSSGQLIADARTAEALVLYLLQSDQPLVTNLVAPAHGAPTSEVMSAMEPALKPKA